ncbi:hypothetical protein [Streptomyces zhihengii]
MTSPKNRRTGGIRDTRDPALDGTADIQLYSNTDAEKAARKVVDRSATSDDDRQLLYAALGLPTAAITTALSVGLIALGHHLSKDPT